MNETDPKVVVSKSVSVSKVSVKVGDVSIARNYDHQHPPVLNPRASQSVDNLINQFLEQLRLTAPASVQPEETQYQLAYGTEDEEDYYSDYLHPSDDYLHPSDDYLHPSDDYLNYLYEMYNSIGDDYYEETDGEEKLGDNANNLYEEFSRSKDPRGRTVDVEEEFSEQLFENGSLTAAHLLIEEPHIASKDKLVDKIFNVSKQTGDVAGTKHEDFSSTTKKLKSSNDNSDVYIKIGIFITVTVAVLLVTGNILIIITANKIEIKLIHVEYKKALLCSLVTNLQKQMGLMMLINDHHHKAISLPSHFDCARVILDVLTDQI